MAPRVHRADAVRACAERLDFLHVEANLTEQRCAGRAQSMPELRESKALELLHDGFACVAAALVGWVVFDPPAPACGCRRGVSVVV